MDTRKMLIADLVIGAFTGLVAYGLGLLVRLAVPVPGRVLIILSIFAAACATFVMMLVQVGGGPPY